QGEMVDRRHRGQSDDHQPAGDSQEESQRAGLHGDDPVPDEVAKRASPSRDTSREGFFFLSRCSQETPTFTSSRRHAASADWFWWRDYFQRHDYRTKEFVHAKTICRGGTTGRGGTGSRS